MRSPSASPAEPAAGGRRYLIAAGTARYVRLAPGADLPGVARDVRRVRSLLERFGYRQVLPELEDSPTVEALRRGLSHWLRSPERRADDVVVVYYAGHGDKELGRHYLLAADSEDEDLVGTALAAEDLVRMLAGSPVQHLLVMLDTCYAGAGTGDLATVAAELAAVRRVDEAAGSGLWFMASARPKDEAEEGVFVDALARALDAVRAGDRQAYLHPSDLIHVMNAELAANGRRQRARYNVGDASGLPPFFPNRNYRPDLPPEGIDLERQRRTRREDLVDHFGPRSRGVEFEAEPGFHFTGRTRALAEIVAWLTAARGGRRVRVVTGAPGSGKSAVLARLVTLADPEYRARVPLEGVPPETVPPVGQIDVAIHARRRSLQELVAAIAAAAGVQVDRPGELIQALRHRGGPLAVVVDALDEAGSGAAVGSDPAGEPSEPHRIANDLLRPLAMVPGVRLLVGTRPELVRALGSTATVLDLDRQEYAEAADLALYARRLLLAEDDPDSPTPYRGDPALAGEVARGVAERAFPNFLVARMISRSLVEGEPIDTTAPGWRDALPNDIGQAFDQYLARFGSNERRVRRLLAPLAYAEGAGLPWDDLWAPLAVALSGEACSDDDIAWLLDMASSYLMEATEQGRSVYRLYHQGLTDHLRATRRMPERETQRRMVTTLRDRVAPRGDGSRRDWGAAHPYVRNHLATHAAAAGLLDELVVDPGFLLAADPERLLRVLSAATGEQARAACLAYEQVVHHLTSKPAAERASYLQLAARYCGATRLAELIDDAGLPRAWSVPWAHWRTTPAQFQLTGHTGEVLAVAIGELEGRPVVVSAGWDGMVRVWDLAAGRPLGAPLTGHTDRIYALAVGELEGRPIVVSAGWDGTVRVWDLGVGRPLGEPLVGHTGGVLGVAVGQLEGRPVAVSAGWDGTVRVWDLAACRPLGAPLAGHSGRVLGVAVGQLKGRPVVVSAGADRTIRVWDLAAGQPLGGPLVGHTDGVLGVTVAEVDGRPVAVSAGADGTVRVWDLVVGRLLGAVLRPAGGVLAVAVGELDGRPIVLSAGWDGAVRVWDLLGGGPLGEPLAGHTGRVLCVAVGELDGQPIVVSAGADRTVRTWHLVAERSLGEQPGHAGGASAVAVGERYGRSIVVSAGWDGTVRQWDLQAGQPLGEPLAGHTDRVYAVVVAQLDGRPTAVSAGADRTVRVWDLGTGRQLGESLAGHTGGVSAVAVGELEGRPIVVSAGWDGTVRVWDLAERRPLGAPLGHAGGVSAVAVGKVGARPIVVSAGWDGMVRVWDLTAGQPLTAPMAGHTGRVSAVAAGEAGGRPIVVSAGVDRTVRVWEPLGGDQLVIDTGAINFGVAFTRGTRIVVATAMGVVALRLLAP